MARKISAIRKEEKQNGHYRTDTGSRDDTNRLSRKRSRNPRRLYMGNQPRSSIPNDTRAGFKTEPDRIAVKDLIRLFTEFFLPKRNTYHNRGEFFWTKQIESETLKDFWQRLIEIVKECAFERRTAEDLQAYWTRDSIVVERFASLKQLRIWKTLKN